MPYNQAVVVDPDAPGKLVLRNVDAPTPALNEAIVQVATISLNRGEIRMAQNAPAGRRLGWDFAGTVTQVAANGSGPKEGERVVGLLFPNGAWANYVAAPTAQIAALPDAVTFEQASTLPVAGLTALHALWKGGFLLERPVLITGATGGVGDYAIQLAKLAGAVVVAHVRRPEQEAFVRTAGADFVVVGESVAQAKQYGPYALILDSVGGQVLGDILGMVEEGTKVVIFGTSAGNQVTFDASRFYGRGMTSLYGLILSDELRTVESADKGLARLAKLVAEDKLKPQICVEANWTQVADIARQLLDRSYSGKAVLHVT